ncbi:putative beta-glucosidase [Sphaerosporella brunnea]|uniref:beta-glucosidase n=1 Tax=Sphaerosporella brunnea TaxID=1250544 RepID=A0A5J5ECS7_9PEZI|nr:putative beta-glucosidase [Sphaerosporella brunnea]
MTLEEKVAQLMQGDISNWLNTTTSGETKAGQFYVGYPVPRGTGTERAQKYLGIPALAQTEASTRRSRMRAPGNPERVYELAKAVARESLALGVNHLVVDLARELRCDARLAGEIGHAFVKGLQGHGVAAAVKHFAGAGTPEGGLNTAPLLITEIRKKKWGYKYHAKCEICNAHGVCEPGVMGAVTMYALTAGNHVEMGGGSFNYRTIPELIAAGSVTLTPQSHGSLSPSARWVSLRIHFLSAPESQWTKRIHSAEAVALARKVDAESIVLLENNGVLPLNKKKLKRIAVVGPMADGFMNYGDYVAKGSMWRGVTPFAGIKSALEGTGAKFTYAKRLRALPVAAARAAEVAVVIVGTWSRDQYELWAGLNATTGEHVDVESLKLVGAQAPLLNAVLEANPNTIVVFSSGKPITEPWISSAASALVQQFYPLSVSFPHDVGTSPSFYDYLKGGRPIDAGAIFDNGTLVFGHQYVLNTPKPLCPFCFGRSYTTVSLSDVAVDKTNVTASDTITVSVTVTNTGKLAGAEVVQVYETDQVASVVVPNMELKGFKTVFLKAGERKKVRVEIDVGGLGVFNVRSKYVVEKGQFVVKVGQHDSGNIQGTASFWVVEAQLPDTLGFVPERSVESANTA